MTPSTDDVAAALLTFWRDAGPKRWFAKSDAFDDELRTRFTEAHFSAAARKLDAWAESADSALAIILLLDQFPRNAFRGTAHTYATDPLARFFARSAVDRGFDEGAGDLRVFFYLPFLHSEDLDDQDRAVELYARLPPHYTEHAHGHRDIIRRFGRFPHRNAMLGRVTTEDERAFLDADGFAG